MCFCLFPLLNSVMYSSSLKLATVGVFTASKAISATIQGCGGFCSVVCLLGFGDFALFLTFQALNMNQHIMRGSCSWFNAIHLSVVEIVEIIQQR